MSFSILDEDEAVIMKDSNVSASGASVTLILTNRKLTKTVPGTRNWSLSQKILLRKTGKQRQKPTEGLECSEKQQTCLYT